MKEREMIVELIIRMKMNENETEEQAYERFYNQLYEGICVPEGYHMDFEYIETDFT